MLRSFMLGIRLEIDKASVKTASRNIQKSSDIRSKKEQKDKEIIKEPGVADTKKGGEAKAAGIGGAVGGFVGALVSNLKPIKDLLEVISGILQIFLVPVMMLLKPFLVFFLKVGMLLYKLFSGKISFGEFVTELLTNLGELLATAGELLLGILLGVLNTLWEIFIQFIGWLWEKLVQCGGFLLEKLVAFGEWLGELLVASWEWMGGIGDKIMGWIRDGLEFLKGVGTKIWGWFVQGFASVLEFGGNIWELFLAGLDSISDLGTKLWDWFKVALSGIADLGAKLWDWIKGSMGGFFGSSKSHNDVLITSSGEVHDFSPQDNILAFKDYSTIANSSSNSNSSNHNIVINIEGFVGSDQDLAEKVSKALSKMGRGSTSNFS